MTQFQKKYWVESARHPKHNYSSKASYFVTIVIANRYHYLGKHQDKNVILNESGLLSKQIWLEIPEKFPGTRLDEFVFMTNHMHGILHFTGEHRAPNPIVESMQLENNHHSLGHVIRWYKAKCTYEIKRLYNPNFGWLSRYHDRIIRDTSELNRIRTYIKNNPLHQ